MKAYRKVVTYEELFDIHPYPKKVAQNINNTSQWMVHVLHTLWTIDDNYYVTHEKINILP